MKSTVNGVTTYFVGNYYESSNGVITKYYYAGGQRIAIRKYTVPVSMTLEYFIGDHLGSTSITTDNAGYKVSEMRYRPFGELRYSWTNAPVTSPSYALSKYTFTGQYSYMDDPSTAGVSEGFGLMFYNARFYDPALGRFTSADSIVPGGVQGYDRYAYANNDPVKYIDPSGHMCSDPEDPTSNCDGADHLGQVSHGGGSELPLISYNGPCVSVACLPTTDSGQTINQSPDLSLLHPQYPSYEYSYSNMPDNYYLLYETSFDFSKVDWLHAGINGLSLVGDAITFADWVLPDPIFAVDETLIAGVSTGINAAGITIDMYDVMTRNDFEGVTIDTLSFVFKEVKGLDRLVPIIGFATHEKGFVEAIKPGIVQIPRIIPIP